MAQRLLSVLQSRARSIAKGCTGLFVMTFAQYSLAGPMLAPGDVRIRSDLELLNDTGMIDVPLTAWPLSAADIRAALADIERSELTTGQLGAVDRVKASLERLSAGAPGRISVRLAGAVEPRIVRGFEYTPRADGEAEAVLMWSGARFFGRLAATAAANTLDGDDFRPDGTYGGVALGNWLLTAGWQDRWWGPGRDGSLMLSTNARPAPGVMLQRAASTPFETRWLSWLGPWTLTTFMSLLDDERAVDEALLFGLRASFRPFHGLEIGLSRSAQWCGEDRSCDLETFADLLIGNDNRGVNVSVEDEPGNQLGGIDVRWVLPRGVPAAVYVQWVGEDGRDGPSPLGSWLRQAGVETWGTLGNYQHRTHLELADTLCREGGLGFSDEKPDCAYGHSIYRTGYRYRDRSLGHGMDSDGLAWSLGSTLVSTAGATWNFSLRHIELNRVGSEFDGHTLAPSPAKLTDVLLTYSRSVPVGEIRLGLGYRRTEVSAGMADESDVEAFVSWRSR